MRTRSKALGAMLGFVWMSGCSVEIAEDAAGSSEGLTPTDHPFDFDRREGPVETLTADQRRARSELTDLVDRVEAAASEPEHMWRDATEDDFREMARLVRAGWAPSVSDAIDADLAATSGDAPPTTGQRDAVHSLADRSVLQSEILWYREIGSLARMKGVGFLYRHADPEVVWRAFETSAAAELDALYGAPGRCQRVITDVRTDDDARFHQLWLEQHCDGLTVQGQSMGATITGENNEVGPGLVIELFARWRPEIESLLPAAGPDSYLAFDVLRTRASAAGDAFVEGFMECGNDACRPVFHVLASHEEIVAVDGVTGDVVRRWDPRAHGGPIKIGSFPAGAAALTPVRYRGANVVSFSGTYLGSTSQVDGTYTLASGPEPYYIGHAGGMPTSGAWPSGRVDRRSTANWNTLQASNVVWAPSTQPTRDFGNPDAWPVPPPTPPPCSTTMVHTSEITYGWTTYFQYLMRDYVGVQVVDTASYNIGGNGIAGSTGWGGCQTWVSNTGAPGSGQSTWAGTSCTWGCGDNVSANPTNDMGGQAHEYAHTTEECAATAGSLCTNTNPGTLAARPPPSQWFNFRRQVWNAYAENFPNMVSTLLTEFRDFNEGAYGGAGSPTSGYRQNWRYGGYFDTTDNFASLLEETANAFQDCNTFGCPTGFNCVGSTDESPVGPTAG